jgi:NADH dehydrogenase (ubiquinone) 1 alpha subcomplex subunit 9
MIVSVFGCTGFLGRYVISGLLKRGATVIVPFHGDDVEVRHLKVMGDLGQVIPMVSA